jgi:uncharacterized protein (TIRG00374 family)
MKPATRTAILALSGILSAAILVYMFATLDWQEVYLLAKRLRWPWLISSLLAYFVSLVLRTERFRDLLYSQSPRRLELLTITSLHNMFNYLLPARSGELSYLFLTKDRLKMPLSESAATLFASRVYDFLSTALILLVVLPFAWDKLPSWALRASLTFSLGVIGICVFIFILVQNASVLNRISPSRLWLSRLWSWFKKVIAGLQEIQRRKKHLRVALLTIGIWACLYANLFFICRGLGYEVDFFQVILVSLLMIPLSLAPVQGFANLGTHELAWVTILMIFGSAYQSALYVAFGTHFLAMAIILFYGLLSLAVMQFLSPLPGN